MEKLINKIIIVHEKEIKNRNPQNGIDAIKTATFTPGECCVKVNKLEPKWVSVSSDDNDDESSIHTKMSNSVVAWSQIMRS